MKRKKPRHRLTETEIARARRLLASGVPRQTIATTLEVSYTALYLALKPYSAGPYPQMGRPKQAPSANAALAEEVFKATISNANTKRAYVRAVAQFLDWCEQCGVHQITPGLAREYMGQLAVSAATKSQTLTPLRHFFDELVTRNAVAFNPFAKQAPNAAFAEEVLKATISNANTKRDYVRCVARFLDWCDQSGVELRQITPGLAARYIGSAPTKSQALAALRRFFDALVTRNAVALNPFASVRGISRSKKSNPE